MRNAVAAILLLASLAVIGCLPGTPPKSKKLTVGQELVFELNEQAPMQIAWLEAQPDDWDHKIAVTSDNPVDVAWGFGMPVAKLVEGYKRPNAITAQSMTVVNEKKEVSIAGKVAGTKEGYIVVHLGKNFSTAKVTLKREK